MAILWLSSFPKSGNTWVRALLANYFVNDEEPFAIERLHDFTYSDSLLWPYEQAAGRSLAGARIDDIVGFKPKAQAILAASRPGLVFVKTHGAYRLPGRGPLISAESTAGAICIVRNPLDVVLSFADHYGLSHEAATAALSDPYLEIGAGGARAPEFLGNWSAHVQGWMTAPALRRQIVRYEDLHADVHDVLLRLVRFLRAPADAARIERAVEHARFDNLQAQEAENGFRERSPNSERFFRRGEIGQWRTDLAPDLVAAVVAAHGDAMRVFGYLDAAGQPLTNPGPPAYRADRSG